MSAAVVAALLVAATGTYLIARGSPSDEPRSEALPPRFEARLEGLQPCDVPVEVLRRVWRGYVPRRSGDILTIEWDPTQFGGVRHSTPWPYTQEVPIVLYGPGFIRRGVTSDREVHLTDIAPTFATLLGFDDYPFERREGEVLSEALLPESERNGVPRLLVTLVWDGGGDNLLAQWPGSWPHLEKLMAEGTNYTRATVGSSPSITPPMHANIGTGAWPKTHGITDMAMRVDGEIVASFAGTNPRRLRAKTLADLWDATNGNEPLVGFMGPYPYQLPMMGHGAYLSEGDHDIAVLADTDNASDTTNESFYSMPDYLENTDGIEEAIAKIDQRDGRADGMWRGNELRPDDYFLRYTPVWPLYEKDRWIKIFENEGFGQDDVADLFFINSKTIDLAGHRWNLVEPEERDVVEETDRQIPTLIEALDRLVGRDNYVIAMTADHGITPYPEVTGGWAIQGAEVVADIQREFDRTPDDSPIVRENRGYQLFLDKQQLEVNEVTPEEISGFLRDYRLEDNAESDAELRGFEQRRSERLFITALTPPELRSALRCAEAKQS